MFEGQTPAALSLEHRVFGLRWSGYHAPRHTVVFSRPGLHALLQRAGFVEAQVNAAFNPAGIAVSLASLTQHRMRRGESNAATRLAGWLGVSTALAPLDVWLASPGIVNFSASGRSNERRHRRFRLRAPARLAKRSCDGRTPWDHLSSGIPSGSDRAAWFWSHAGCRLASCRTG